MHAQRERSLTLALVEGQDDQGPLVVESTVGHERYQPILEELGREVDIGVVSVVEDIRRYEHPGREGVGGDVLRAS